MTRALSTIVVLLALASVAQGATRVTSPPLRYPGDTRSAFCWAPVEQRFPQAAMVTVQVTRQLRPRPNPWEVAWVVIGDERRFVAFVPKPNGWELSLFDVAAWPQQRFLASGRQPRFPVGDPITVTLIAFERGVAVVCGELLVVHGWSAEHPRPTDAGHARPTWWGSPARAGVYVEDCTAIVSWERRTHWTASVPQQGARE